MKNNKLTIQNYGFRERLFKFIDMLFQKQFDVVKYNSSNYTLIKDLSNKRVNSKTHVGLYKGKDGKKVIIKTVDINYKGIEYYQQLIEFKVLKYFSGFKFNVKGYMIGFPEIYRLVFTKKQVSLIRQYISGKQLKSYPRTEKIKILNNCLHYLTMCSERLDTNNKSSFPKVRKIFVFAAFPFYLVKVLVKDIKFSLNLLYYLYTFYKYIFRISSFLNNETAISHRDLHQENIIVNRNKVYIIDPEICILGHKETDLAIVSKFYYKDIGFKSIEKLLRKYLKDDSHRNNFIVLSLFYSILLMSNESKNSKLYEQTKHYLKDFKKHLIPLLENSFQNNDNNFFRFFKLQTSISLVGK